jgi:glucan phosphorylase
MLNETLNKIDGGFFSPQERRRYHDLFNSLVNYGDHYLLLADYADYVETQGASTALYKTPRSGSARPFSTSPAWGRSRPTGRFANTRSTPGTRPIH